MPALMGLHLDAPAGAVTQQGGKGAVQAACAETLNGLLGGMIPPSPSFYAGAGNGCGGTAVCLPGL